MMVRLGNKMIYLDHPATSWPKPPQVKEAMNRYMDQVGANPGRSGHALSIEAARILYDAREALAALFHVKDSSRIVFTMNATESINLALKGLLKPGDHVVTSSVEHNSVMRPLRELEKQGVELSIILCSQQGGLDTKELESKIKPNTKMVVLSHASNVTGMLLPIREVGLLTQKHKLLFLVDAAQTAGAFPIDVEQEGIDLLAFTGHKSLYGPPGTGGLVIGKHIDEKEMVPLKQGGTGSRSEYEEQPEFLPDRFESGTPNSVGLAGLLAGVQFVLEKGVDQIRKHEMILVDTLIREFKKLPQIKLYGPEHPDESIALLSFNFKNLSPSQAVLRLEREFGILCRAGLHCAPAAHRTIGTFPEGTIRFGLSIFNTEEEIEKILQAVSSMAHL